MARIKPEKRTAARAIFAGSIVMLFVILLTALTFDAVNGLPFRSTTTVRAEFGDIHSLDVNDDVRQNSMRIGRVSALTVRGGKALVTMELDGHPKIYRDAHASILDVSALATKFVELDPGTPQAGPIGDDIIPAGRNENSADIYQLLDVFDPATRPAFTSMVRQVGGGLAEHGGDLHDFLGSGPDLLHNVGAVSDDVASPQFNLADLISSSDDLVTHFEGREQQISDLIRQTDTTFRGLTTTDGAGLQNTLAKAPSTLRAIRPALDSLNTPLANTQVAMTNLQPGGQALGDATPDMRGFLTDSVPVVNQVPSFSDDAEPAVKDLAGTVQDARPLAPRARDTFDYLHTPLQVLAPYSGEIGQWFTRMHSFVGQGSQDGVRYAHLLLGVGAQEATGGVLNAGSNVNKDPYPVLTDAYPKPNQDETDRQPLPFGLGHLGGRH